MQSQSGDFEDFADSLTGFADATRSRRLSSVKSLIAYACQVRYLHLDVGAPVQLPKIKDSLAERIIDENLVMRLLDKEKHPRNAALMTLIYAAGLRVSEACGLRWKDMKARDSSGQATIFGKGGKTRAILLPPGLWGQLTALRGDADPEDFVFRSRKGGGGILRMQVHCVVKAAAKRAQLPPGFSTHWLRHAHVSHALKRNTPVHIVQATVGHSSLTTTTRYAHAMPDDSSALHLAVG
jgi:integrase/recombinase XerD